MSKPLSTPASRVRQPVVLPPTAIGAPPDQPQAKAPAAVVGKQLKRRPRRRSHDPVQGPALVEHALKRLHLDNSVSGYRAMRAFALACGERLGRRARAERFSRKSLFIRVESSAWANEISFMKQELLQQIHRTVGGEDVKDLRFSVGPVAELPSWAEPPPRIAPQRAPVPVDHDVAAALTQVPDDELRDRLASLYHKACIAGR